MDFLYRTLQRVARRFGGVLARPGSKLSRGLEGRRHAYRTLAQWGREKRDPYRPVVWVHAPSVGEGLQARAVIEELAVRRPDAQLVYTHFSPSAEALASRMPVDVASYLPWDLADEVTPAVEAVRPDLVVYTKTEVWPLLTRTADERGSRAAIIAASVPDRAGRRGRLARRFLHATWASLDLACAVTDVDARRLRELGVRPDVVRTSGDPGIDSAADRVRAADERAPYLAPFHARPAPTLVAGSTWLADEDVLLPALVTVKRRHGELRAVIAPHEPTTEVVAGLLERLAADGWRGTTLSDVADSGVLDDHDAVVVDGVGLLAHLYTVGHVAYVGGGFHDAGLHSVLEPAAAGIPVVFGPKHGNAAAAGALVDVGGAKIAANPDELTECLSGWLRDGAARREAGKQAFHYIDAHRGAAARTAELLEPLLETPTR